MSSKKVGGARNKKDNRMEQDCFVETHLEPGLLGSDPICCEVGISGQSRRHRIALGLGERF